MESFKTHPLVVIAAVAVTAFSLVGIASITGLIPSHRAADTPPPVASPAPVAAPVAANVPTPPPAAASAIPASKADTGTTINVPAGASVSVNPPPAKVPHHTAPKHPPATAARQDAPAFPPPNTPPPAAAYTPPAPVCNDCGVIDNIREITRKGQGTGLGAVAGGLLGGILGHQVGGGRGRDVATVAGAIGGVVAGNEIEKSSHGVQQYQISVRLDDGSTRVITQDTPPAWRIGDRVRINNGALSGN